jgi:hypothetical protein
VSAVDIIKIGPEIVDVRSAEKRAERGPHDAPGLREIGFD